jgi:hypothetical protein
MKERILRWEKPTKVNLHRTSSLSRSDSEVLEAIRRMPDGVRRELATLLRTYQLDVDPSLWGEDPDLSEAVEAALWHGAEFAQRQTRVLAQSLSLEEAAAAASLPQTDIAQLAEVRAVSTVAAGSEIRLPGWQFDDAGRLLPDLGPLIAVFPGTAVALAEWVERENVDLGCTPREALTSGERDAVVFAATRGSGIA